jgi:ribosomal protein S12 methylthiotransferase accessory factor
MTEHEMVTVSTSGDMSLTCVQAELWPLSDSTTVLRAPNGRLYEVECPATQLETLLRAFDGQRTTSQAIEMASTDRREQFAQLVEVLTVAGCLGPRPRQRSSVPRRGLVLTGTDRLRRLIVERGLHRPFAHCREVELGDLESVVAERAPDLVVVALDHFDHDVLLGLNDLCAEAGPCWASFHLDGGRGWLGPLVVPGATADYRDLLNRRRAAAENLPVFEAMLRPARTVPAAHRPADGELTWMLAAFFQELERWLAAGPCVLVGHEIEADPAGFRLTAHPFLPLPDRCPDGGIRPVDRSELVDPRCGVITGLRTIHHHPSVPRPLVTVQAYVCDMRRLYAWASDTLCTGSAFHDRQAATNAAVGESIERYCVNWLPSAAPSVEASFAELRARGERALDPEALCLYSDRQYGARGFPFVRFTRDLPVHWVRGTSLSAGAEAWLPASLVYANWRAGDPPTHFFNYPGIAAGPDLESALAAALEEIIERDATMIWWLNAAPLPAVRPTPELASLWTGVSAEHGQRAWLIHLDNEFGVPVLAGALENRPEVLFNMGFAARPSAADAAAKAWTEAITLQEGSRDLLVRDGSYRQAVARGAVAGHFMKPWRADRRYLDDYRPDFHDVTDLMCQQQVFLDPAARLRVAPWVDVPEERDLAQLPSPGPRCLDTYRRCLEATGCEIFYADVTTPDVAGTGLTVVRALVPGLVANAPAAFPCLGRRRVQDTAVRLGWRESPLDEQDLNYFPLPHA